ncbi:acetolactate synthase 2 small subunit [Catenovulum sp. SX2]|mgnify:CR=1 FL=1|uniref:acetolactate synthase 2 small subunit n=1 Tax=Catenovulum TaxID=1172191 RepID=UPI00030526CA|nr:acetolactate synthase 2 small subunit [Catenovulum agarivorans]
MTHTINLIAQSRPETMERVLRVVRHRGFALNAVEMKNCDKNNTVNIQLTVSGERPISNLEHQLKKLYDVTELELNSALSQSAVAMNA